MPTPSEDPFAGLKPSQWIENDIGPVLICEVPTKDAFETWLRLKEAASQTGRWPVMVGSPDELSFFEQHQDESGVRLDLKNACKIAPDFLITKAHRELTYGIQQYKEEELDFSFDPFEVERLEFEPANLPDLYRPAGATTVIALPPTPYGWEVPAHLGNGGWNSYPEISEHVAWLKLWHERHGVELAVLTHDIVELYLPSPIEDPVVAKELVPQIFSYCPENFGEFPLIEAAKSILGNPTWGFWWD